MTNSAAGRSQEIGAVVFNLACAAAAIFGMSFAALQLHAYLATGDQRMLAQEIDAGVRRRLGYYLEFAGTEGTERSLPFTFICQRDILRVRAHIQLASLDAAIEDGDPRSVERSLDAASVALRDVLKCAPLDGDSWLRLAMVSGSKATTSAGVVDMLRASYLTTPNELSVVRRRVQFASLLFESGTAGVDIFLRSDILSLLKWGRREDLIPLIYAAAPQVREFYRASFAGVLGDRRTALLKMFERCGFHVPSLSVGRPGQCEQCSSKKC